MFSIRWRARGRLPPGPDRPNGVPSFPAPPRPAAPPCAAPTRPARGVSGFWLRQVSFVRSSEKTFKTMFSIPWKASGKVVFKPGRPDEIPFYPALPSFATPPCAASTRPAHSVSEFWIRQTLPGYALYEKGLLRQKGVHPLVSSKEQRALLVPRLNRGSTAGFIPPSVSKHSWDEKEKQIQKSVSVLVWISRMKSASRHTDEPLTNRG